MRDNGIIQVLFVIAVLFFSIIGSVNKSKKKPIDTSTPPLNKGGGDIFGELKKMLEQAQNPDSEKAKSLLPKTSQKSNKQAIDHVPLDYFEKKRLNYLNHKITDLPKTLKTSLKQLEIIDNFDDDDKSDFRSFHIDLKNQENARLAFVYSEIFNRKY